jgi:hypothetical protein
MPTNVTPVGIIGPSTKKATQPSSSATGFFQTPPKLENQFYEDTALRRVLARKHKEVVMDEAQFADREYPIVYLPSNIQSSVFPDLSRFGAVVLSKKVLRWVADAEKNPPFLRSWDTWGKRTDELVTSEGWRNLQELGIAEG